jgi:hypothetical protein
MFDGGAEVSGTKHQQLTDTALAAFDATLMPRWICREPLPQVNDLWQKSREQEHTK